MSTWVIEYTRTDPYDELSYWTPTVSYWMADRVSTRGGSSNHQAASMAPSARGLRGKKLRLPTAR